MTFSLRAAMTATLLLTALAGGSAAHASGTQPRSWVSAAKGVDAANCGTAGSPCRSFQYALDNAVVAGGTILVLDPGGYGTLVILNPVSIVNEGVGPAGIFGTNPATKDAVSINLASGGAVTLEGLIIDGAGANGNGVEMTSTGVLTLENCTITSFTGSSQTGSGVAIRPTFGVAKFLILDSTITRNSNYGVVVIPNYLVSGAAGAEGVVRRSNLSFNPGYGLSNNSAFTTGAVKITVEDTIVTENAQYGLNASGSALGVLELNHVTATRNGWSAASYYDVRNGGGPTVKSYGNNIIGTSAGTISSAQLQ